MRPLPAAGGRREIASELGSPESLHIASRLGAGMPLDESADGSGAGDQEGSVLGGVRVTDINVDRQQARQQLVGFGPSPPSDSMLGLARNSNGRVNQQIERASLIGNKGGGVLAGPSNPAQGGDQGRGGARSDGPPRTFGMREFMSGPIECVLHVRHGEPFVPYRKGPMPNDSGVRLKGGVQSAAGAVRRQEGKDRVFASRSGRGS